MVEQEIDLEARITGIALGTGGDEGVPIAGRHRRRHGVEDQVIILTEHVHQRSTLPLDSDGDGASGKTLVQVHGPKLDGFGSIEQEAAF
jgi:hypothetical protein